MLYLVVLILTIIGQKVLSQHSCSTDGCVLVENNCPFTLYLQRTVIDGSNENLPTSVTTISSGGESVLDISGWKDLSGQRLYAWWSNPVGNTLNPLQYRDKVEINWCGASQSQMCYNPTAVDYFGLPVTMGPYNSDDCPSVEYTGQDSLSITQIESLCPTQYTSTGAAGVCVSPYQLCINEPSNSLCSLLDDRISACGDECYGGTTTNVWGCNGVFAEEPDLCAALHRGLEIGADQTDTSTFYINSPYNEYAQFVHYNDEKHYAFPYDDVGGQGTSGYNVCETNFLSVTFCPADSSSSGNAGYEYLGCYADTSDRALRYGPGASGGSNYNAATCSTTCSGLGYTYFALQYYGECYCDNSYDHATKYGVSTNCPDSQLGGGWANDLFVLSSSAFSNDDTGDEADGFGKSMFIDIISVCVAIVIVVIIGIVVGVWYYRKSKQNIVNAKNMEQIGDDEEEIADEQEMEIVQDVETTMTGNESCR